MEDDNHNDESNPAQDAGGDGLREPWQRRPDESQKAFDAFQMYLNSVKRSLTDIAKDSKFQCSTTNIWRWSVVHDWKNRAWAFDVNREREQEQQLARDRVSMRSRHLKVSMVMQEIAVRGLMELQAKMASGTPLNLSPDEVRSLMDAAVKLERLTLGTDRDRKFTSIVVNVGTHRYAGEPCGCDCTACASCSGPSDGAPILEAEGQDEPPKLN
jgi:hypothetical protein